MCACCGGDCKLIYQREEQESKKTYKSDKFEDIRQKLAEIVDELHEIMETLTVGTFSEQ